MHARSALFDLFGDHLRHRDDQAPVSGVLRLLGPLGINGPAARTAISRMVAQGWLEPITLPSGPGYRASASAERRFEDTSARIYATRPAPWDGTWHLVVGDPPADRSRRERLRADLRFLGYARIGGEAWLSPYRRDNLTEVLDRAGVRPHTARVTDLEPVPLDAWDLDRLATAYAAWPDAADDIIEQSLAQGTDPDEAAFTARFRLVHEWRKFLFDDPGLPRELLPPDWPGVRAAHHFTEAAARLKPAADRFLDACLEERPAAESSPSLPN